MKERPILFSAPMVRAILEGRKTQTRRIVTAANSTCDTARLAEVDMARAIRDNSFGLAYLHAPLKANDGTMHRVFPRVEVGNRLWVRETWALATSWCTDMGCVQYRADSAIQGVSVPGLLNRYGAMRSFSDGWRPSIFMPRWASRITLEVTGLRVERVHDITEADARAEGVTATAPLYGDCGGVVHEGHRDAFSRLWDLINAKRGYGWEANPWVWVVEFRRVEVAP